MKNVWLGRTNDGEYELGSKRKGWRAEGGFIVGGGWLLCMCAEDLHSITGYKLAPGEVRKVRIFMEDA